MIKWDGGALASWIVRLTSDRAFRVTLTVTLSTQVYKWVPTNFMLGIAAMDQHPIQGGVEISLVHERRRDVALGSFVDFTCFPFTKLESDVAETSATIALKSTLV